MSKKVSVFSITHLLAHVALAYELGYVIGWIINSDNPHIAALTSALIITTLHFIAMMTADGSVVIAKSLARFRGISLRARLALRGTSGEITGYGLTIRNHSHDWQPGHSDGGGKTRTTLEPTGDGGFEVFTTTVGGSSSSPKKTLKIFMAEPENRVVFHEINGDIKAYIPGDWERKLWSL